ncbi:hypothetical protein BFW01_g12783 [Lasiodiplodia theobromae]|nr:hypothetical protein BFW01_g12783 [Lasiodiplodia theobromae]
MRTTQAVAFRAFIRTRSSTHLPLILHEAAKKKFPATTYTDLVIQGKHQKFHCHKFAVLRQLPDLEDTLQRIITYNHFDNGDVDDVILAMLKFIYMGYYDGPSDFPECDLLYLHSRVYWLASSYSFQELKEYSKAKFSLYVDHDLSMERFLEDPRIHLGLFYDAPFDTSRGLKDVILGFCARHTKEIMSDSGFYYNDELPDNFWKELAWYLAGCPELPAPPEKSSSDDSSSEMST